jgi:Mrp family chromosome partitioning ATPase
LTDARLLAREADGVILVFRAGATSAEQSLSVLKSFSQDGTHVFGTILNDWNAVAEDPAYVNSYTKYAGT